MLRALQLQRKHPYKFETSQRGGKLYFKHRDTYLMLVVTMDKKINPKMIFTLYDLITTQQQGQMAETADYLHFGVIGYNHVVIVRTGELTLIQVSSMKVVNKVRWDFKPSIRSNKLTAYSDNSKDTGATYLCARKAGILAVIDTNTTSQNSTVIWFIDKSLEVLHVQTINRSYEKLEALTINDLTGKVSFLTRQEGQSTSIWSVDYKDKSINTYTVAPQTPKILHLLETKPDRYFVKLRGQKHHEHGIISIDPETKLFKLQRDQLQLGFEAMYQQLGSYITVVSKNGDPVRYCVSVFHLPSEKFCSNQGEFTGGIDKSLFSSKLIGDEVLVQRFQEQTCERLLFKFSHKYLLAFLCRDQLGLGLDIQQTEKVLSAIDYEHL